MRSIFYASFLVVCTGLWLTPASAQFDWTNTGPDNLGYIVRTITFDNNNNLLAGIQGGGLWRSTNGGESWSPVAGYTQTPDPNNPNVVGLDPNVTTIAVSGNTIVVGTGGTAFSRTYARAELAAGSDYDFRRDPSGFQGNLDSNPGDGVYISTNNGESWTRDNATNTGDFALTRNYDGPFANVFKVIISNNRIIMGTLEGVYISDDNLNTIRKANGPDFLGSQIVYDLEAAEGGRIFATAHDDRNANDSLFMSTDNGATFTSVRDEEIFQAGRMSFVRSEVSISSTDRNLVYLTTTAASGEVSGVFRKNFANPNSAWQPLVTGGGSGFEPLGTTSQDAIALTIRPDDPNSVILAGFNWYTYNEAEGWVQRAQHISPFFTFLTEDPFIPRSIYTVVFDPNNPNAFYIGTSNGVYYSDDNGETVVPRSKGLEAMATYSVAATYVSDIGVVESNLKDAVFASTQNSGIIENHLYNSELPSRQAYGQIWNINKSRIEASHIFPGGLVAQSADGGLVRSVNYGEAFETFYNISVSPQAANLTPAGDTLIDRANASSAGGGLFNLPTPAQSVFALDEYLSPDLINNEDLTQEELQDRADSYIYFCSQNYVWLVQNGLNTDNAFPSRWNRITADLVDGLNEVFTAMIVSDDERHTVFLGTNKGNVYRIDRANDLENFDAATQVVWLNEDLATSGLVMPGRWISDLALDPNQPDRLVVTFAGFGAVGEVTSWIWATDSAYAAQPQFGQWLQSPITEPVYAAEYVTDPANGNESVLLLGTQKGLYSIRGLDLFVQGTFRAYLVDTNADGSITPELPELGTVPVYDIYTRPYRQFITAGALTRSELRPVNQGDTTVLQPFNVQRDQVIIRPDQTLYVATHGRGVWTSSSVAPQREASQGPNTGLLPDLAYKIGPNPASDAFTLKIGLPGEATITTRLVDIHGRTVMQGEEVWQGGWQTKTFNTTNVISGLYFLQVEVAGADFTDAQIYKVLIEK